MSKLQSMSFMDLKGLKKAAALRGEITLEMMVQDEMDRRVDSGEVDERELIAAAYL